jgi:hypothetical protein
MANSTLGAAAHPAHRPSRRRLIIGLRGSVTDLLTLSQVVLAPASRHVPALHSQFRRRTGARKNGWFLLITGLASSILITVMDVYGLPDSLKGAWHVITGE